MPTFNTNQVRQVIVVDSTSNVALANGDGGKYITYVDVLGKTRATDLIPTGGLRKKSSTIYTARSLRVDTVTVADATASAVVGQDYGFHIKFREWGSGSQENTQDTFVTVTAESGDTMNTILNKLTTLGNKMYYNTDFAKFPSSVLRFAHTNNAATMTITEVAQPWILGKAQERCADYYILRLSIISSGVETFDWCTLATTTKAYVGSGTGKLAADLEYFYKGEIGDFYRMSGWPDNIDVKYQVDPAATYDTVDFTFFSQGTGTNNQFQEKQLLVLCKRSSSDTAGSLGAVATEVYAYSVG